MDACLLHFDDEAASAARLAAATGLEARCIERHRFPDGEIKVRLPLERAPLPQQVVLLRSLAQPNEKLVELLLAAQTARSLGVRALTLVAPYLAYMRQDIAFTPGEAVSQRIVGGFLAGLFDAVLTVDPHLHRVHTLAEAIPLPEERALALSAAPCWPTASSRIGRMPGWWGPMPSPSNGWHRPPRATGCVGRSVASAATVTAGSR